jgi:hypothetical protein
MIKRMIKSHPTQNRMPGQALSGYRPTTWIGTVSERLAGCRREQPPGSGHSLELMVMSVVEADVGADEQVLHRARDQHLTIASERRNPGRDMDSQPSQIRPAHLDLPDMDAGTNLEPQRPHRLHHGKGAPHRRERTVERREEAVPRRHHLPAAEAGQLAAAQPLR